MALTLFLLCIWIICPVDCYQCPPPALKTRHASKICQDLSFYHCLWNTLIDDYYDVCLKPETSYTPGSYIVYSNALNARRCPTERYQPFAYSTNELNECVYNKSNCTEEGQIRAATGDYTEDATCKCNYTKGYSYLILPDDPCQCKPSEEDCSCYLTQCLNRTHRLSPDYKCEQINSDIIRQYQCPRIKQETKENGHHKDRYNSTGNEYKDNVVRQSVDTSFVAIIVTCMVLVMITVFVATFGALMYRERTYWYAVRTYRAGQIELETQLKLQDIIERCNKHYQKVMQEDTVKDTTTFRHAKATAENNHIVILQGRKGTGKTTLAMHLASIYIKQQYKLAVLYNDDEITLADIQRSSQKIVVILEECFDTSVQNAEKTKLQTDMLSIHNFQKDFKIIVTAAHLNENQLEKMRLNRIMTENNVVNLDKKSPELIEDNQSIMRCLLKKYNRELSDDEIKEVAAINTYYGFPLQCLLFCQDSRNFTLGSKFFRQPPVDLLDMINALQNSKEQRDSILFCVLVYALLNFDNGLDINDLDTPGINSIFKEVFKPSLLDNKLSRMNIKNSLNDISFMYFQCRELHVFFLHPVVYQAVMISYSNLNLETVVQKCEFGQLLDIIRPSTYGKLEREVVLIIDHKKASSVEDMLAKRMADACLTDTTLIHKVMLYIRKFQFFNALRKTMVSLDTRLQSTITDQRVENVVVLMEDMTSNGNSLDLLQYAPSTFVLTWAFIVLQKLDRNDLIRSLVDRYIIRGQRKFAVDILRTTVDQHNNSFLHYCVLWWHNKENSFIRYLDNELQHNLEEWIRYTENNFKIINTQQMSAVDFAAYFGNHALLQAFVTLKIETAMNQMLPLAKIQKVKEKEEARLRQYTENGTTNNSIESYSSCPFLNMTVCGHIDVNDAFDYGKTVDVLNSLRETKS